MLDAEIQTIIRIAVIVALMDGKASGQEQQTLASEVANRYRAAGADQIQAFIAQTVEEYQNRDFSADLDTASTTLESLADTLNSPVSRNNAFRIAYLTVGSDGRAGLESPYLALLRGLLHL